MCGTQIKIAVCDDMPYDRLGLVQMLTEYLDRNDILAQIDSYASARELLSSQVSEYSLIIMDIIMDEISGIEAAKKLLDKNIRTKIIFCSTSLDFAADSYEVNALYYLIKPVDSKKLNSVLDRFFYIYTSLKTITVKVGRAEESIYVTDILYVESARKKGIIHTKHGNIEASLSLSQIGEMLPKGGFIRPIRYAIVSLSEIASVPSDNLILSDNTCIKISRNERERVKEEFLNYKWKMMLACN